MANTTLDNETQARLADAAIRAAHRLAVHWLDQHWTADESTMNDYSLELYRRKRYLCVQYLKARKYACLQIPRHFTETIKLAESVLSVLANAYSWDYNPEYIEHGHEYIDGAGRRVFDPDFLVLGATLKSEYLPTARRLRTLTNS